MFSTGSHQNPPPPDLSSHCSEHAKAFVNECFVCCADVHVHVMLSVLERMQRIKIFICFVEDPSGQIYVGIGCSLAKS